MTNKRLSITSRHSCQGDGCCRERRVWNDENVGEGVEAQAVVGDGRCRERRVWNDENVGEGVAAEAVVGDGRCREQRVWNGQSSYHIFKMAYSCTFL